MAFLITEMGFTPLYQIIPFPFLMIIYQPIPSPVFVGVGVFPITSTGIETPLPLEEVPQFPGDGTHLLDEPKISHRCRIGFWSTLSILI
jgi:hypothetical protein